MRQAVAPAARAAQGPDTLGQVEHGLGLTLWEGGAFGPQGCHHAWLGGWGLKEMKRVSSSPPPRWVLG